MKEAAGNTDTQVTADKAAAIGSHVLGRPRQDSNLRTRLRRAVLYPLSYGGSRTEKEYQ